MAMSPSDHLYALVKETVSGTTPATPAWLRFPHSEGTEPVLESDVLTSPAVEANRSSAGQRKVNYRVGGGLKAHLRRAPAFDLLWESLMGASFTTNVLKAGTTDISFTVQKKMLNNGTPYFHRFTGCQTKKIAFSVSPEAVIEATYDLVGQDRVTATTEITGFSYPPVANSTRLAGVDGLNFSVTGVAAVCHSFDFSCEIDKEHQDAIGNTGAIGVGTMGTYRPMVKAKFYRSDLSLDTLMAKSDAFFPVTFDVGSGANAYRVFLPAAQADIPTDEVSGSKPLVTVNFFGAWDATAASPIVITKLT